MGVYIVMVYRSTLKDLRMIKGIANRVISDVGKNLEV